jgi:hypothetical protein
MCVFWIFCSCKQAAFHYTATKMPIIRKMYALNHLRANWKAVMDVFIAANECVVLHLCRSCKARSSPAHAYSQIAAGLETHASSGRSSWSSSERKWAPRCVVRVLAVQLRGALFFVCLFAGLAHICYWVEAVGALLRGAEHQGAWFRSPRSRLGMHFSSLFTCGVTNVHHMGQAPGKLPRGDEIQRVPHMPPGLCFRCLLWWVCWGCYINCNTRWF